MSEVGMLKLFGIGMAGICYIVCVGRNSLAPIRERKWITMEEVANLPVAKKPLVRFHQDDDIEPVDRVVTGLMHFLTAGLTCNGSVDALSLLFSFKDSPIPVWYNIPREPERETLKPEVDPVPTEDVPENAMLSQKVHCCGLAEVLIPLPESTQSLKSTEPSSVAPTASGGIAVNTPIQRYRLKDLLHNVQENEKVQKKSEILSRELEKEYCKVLEEKNTLAFRVQEVEAIRCEAERSTRNMQAEMDQLRQIIQDYSMQTNDLSSQLSQLTLELRLVELTLQANSENNTDNDSVIQSILNEMNAEINKEKAELLALRDINEKLKREEDLDDIRRTKYELELQQLEEQIALETVNTDYDNCEEEEDTFFNEGKKDNSIYGFAAPSTPSLRKSKSNIGASGSGFW